MVIREGEGVLPITKGEDQSTGFDRPHPCPSLREQHPYWRTFSATNECLLIFFQLSQRRVINVNGRITGRHEVRVDGRHADRDFLFWWDSEFKKDWSPLPGPDRDDFKFFLLNTPSLSSLASPFSEYDGSTGTPGMDNTYIKCKTPSDDERTDDRKLPNEGQEALEGTACWMYSP